MSVIMSKYVRLFHVFSLLAQFGLVWAPIGVGVDVVVGVDVACEDVIEFIYIFQMLTCLHQDL